MLEAIGVIDIHQVYVYDYCHKLRFLHLNYIAADTLQYFTLSHDHSDSNKFENAMSFIWLVLQFIIIHSNPKQLYANSNV